MMEIMSDAVVISNEQIEAIGKILGVDVRAIAIGTPHGFTCRIRDDLDPTLMKNYAENFIEVGAGLLADSCKELGRREVRSRMS
jgi:fructose/tagatose bisphosphate aldolase